MLIEKAIDLANRAHHGQVRKYSGLPYIVHPAAVATMVMTLPGATEEMIAAAWLHDVLEDCGMEFCAELRDNFPADVFRLVKELTNVGGTGSREVRKQRDRERLATVSVEAQRMKLVDRLLNLRDMELAPEGFLHKYLQESKLLVDVLRHAQPSLAAACDYEIERLRARMYQGRRDSFAS